MEVACNAVIPAISTLSQKLEEFFFFFKVMADIIVMKCITYEGITKKKDEVKIFHMICTEYTNIGWIHNLSRKKLLFYFQIVTFSFLRWVIYEGITQNYFMLLVVGI